ncbi:MAG: hypothetical protein RMJ90_00080 [Candidatus Bipolaricaulota bacterium]|nr:hypothetical protein [Candidatus Bipolaricaulota bacterium]
MNYIWMILGIVMVALGLVFFLMDAPKTGVTADQQIKVMLKEWAIQTDLKEIRAGAVRFIIWNNGGRPHGLAAMALLQGREQSVLIVEQIDPAQMRSVLVELKPGEYTLYDPLYCRNPFRGNCEKNAMAMLVKLNVR